MSRHYHVKVGQSLSHIITQLSIYEVIVYFWYLMSHWIIAWALNTEAFIDMCDDDVRMVRLHLQMLCNNGRIKAWFGNFKLQ